MRMLNVAVLILTCSSPVDPQTELSTLQRAVNEHRREIKSGIFEIHCAGRYSLGVDEFDDTYALEGRLRRIERKWLTRRGKVLTEGDRYRDLVAFGEKKHVWYTEARDSVSQARIMLNYFDLTKIGADNTGMQITDPRLLGNSCDDLRNTVHFNLGSGCFLWRGKMKDIQIVDATIDGSPCKQVSYKDEKGNEDAWVVDIGRGYNLLSRKIKATAGGTSIIESVKSELPSVSDSGIWFPSKVSYRREENGKEVTSEQLTIRLSHLNKPIAPKLFTLAGMDILPGTGINENPPSTHKQQVWDGHEIKVIEPPLATAPRVFQPVTGGTNWSLLMVSIGSGLVFLGVLWKLLKPKPASGT